MSETFKFNGHTYRAYPMRYYCDGIEIPPAEFFAVIRLIYPRANHH